MTRWLILLLFTGPSLAFANCDLDLRTEFAKPPNDVELGLVTDRIPLTVKSIGAAYARGLFPWNITVSGTGEWYSPAQRGVLFLDGVEIPRGDRKAIRKVLESGKYEIRVDTDFKQVITECALQTRFVEQEIAGVMTKVPAGRWITDTHIEEYTKLHEAGLAHSYEIWEGDKMVGGLYGVFVNGYFSGESMFHKANDVTKVLYAALIDRLAANGHLFIDTQQNVGLTEKWGGKLIPRREFLYLLHRAREADKPF